MPLGNTKMQAILKEYDAIREKNRALLNARKEEVAQNAPDYFRYKNEIISLCMKKANNSLFPAKTDLDANTYQLALARLRKASADALMAAGYPSDYLEPVYDCSLCNDTGFVTGTQCTCLKKRITRVLYAQSGIEHMLETNNFSTLSYEYYKGEDLVAFQNAVQVCKDMVANFDTRKDSLLLYGTVGCGKSFLSGCVAKELMDKGASVVYFSASQFFNTLHANTLYNNEEELYNNDLVLIDDLGAELTNSFVTTALFSFLNERILRGKATIISTNLNLAELRERYGERISSRIVRNFKTLKLSGPDIRILQRLSERK